MHAVISLCGLNRNKYLVYATRFTVLITGLLGLPPSSGLIPQNPMHSLSLISNQNSERGRRLMEQRISAIILSLLLLLTILVLPLEGFIPFGVLWGGLLQECWLHHASFARVA